MEETNIRSVEDAVNVSAPTEDRNPASVHIDRLPTLEVLQLLNAEDSTVPTAVSAVLPELARLVDAAVVRIRAGGGVHYFGAGTSGRLAVLDAAELMPTFNSPVVPWPCCPPSRTSRTTRRPAAARRRSSGPAMS